MASSIRSNACWAFFLGFDGDYVALGEMEWVYQAVEDWGPGLVQAQGPEGHPQAYMSK